MPLLPPNNPTPLNNPSESFAWLHDLIATIPNVVGGNHNGFECTLHAGAPVVRNGIVYQDGIGQQPAGIHTNGGYWVGFYYRLWNNSNAKALPWFGCEFDHLHRNSTLIFVYILSTIKQWIPVDCLIILVSIFIIRVIMQPFRHHSVHDKIKCHFMCDAALMIT